MAIISGTPFTYSTDATVTLNQDQRRVEIPEEIFYEMNDASPILTVSKLLGKRRVGNPKFGVFQKSPLPDSSLVVSGTLASLVVSTGTGQYFKPGDLIKVSGTAYAYCICLVTAVSTDTLTCTTTFGGTSYSPAAADSVVRIGSAAHENDTDPAIKLQKVDTISNYTQIFKHPFGASRTLQKSDLIGPSFMEDSAKEALIEMKKKIEMSLLYGEAKEIMGTGNAPIRETGGLLWWLLPASGSGGVAPFACSASPTLIQFENFARQAFDKVYDGDGPVFLFCSPLWISQLNYWANNKLQLRLNESLYGLKTATWVTGHGEWVIVRHPLLKTVAGSTATAGHDGWAISVPAKLMEYIVFADDDVHLLTNRQSNNVDGVVSEYLAEVGFGMKLAGKCGIIRGMTTVG